MPSEGIRHYYVDEAGDPTLFNRRGKVIVGCEGCSHTFAVGVADIADPPGLDRSLRELRTGLLADPYFRGVPSMRSEAGKTAHFFHAKDDLPEILRLLSSVDMKVLVAVRRKAQLAHVFKTNPGYAYSPNSIYDDLVKRVFRNLVSRGDDQRVIFASRGSRDRQTALRSALGRAALNYESAYNRKVHPNWKIDCGQPTSHAGLQAVDYMLWAFQRLIERGEDRFYEAVADKFRLVMDLDDTRTNGYGVYYSSSSRLSLEKLKPLRG